jgi:hypothetical protein
LVVALAPSEVSVSGEIIQGRKRTPFKFAAPIKTYAKFVQGIQDHLHELAGDDYKVEYTQSPLAAYLKMRAHNSPLMAAFIGRFVDANYHYWDRASFIQKMDRGMQHGGTLGTNQKLLYAENEKEFMRLYKHEAEERMRLQGADFEDIENFATSHRLYSMERGVLKPGDVYLSITLA